MARFLVLPLLSLLTGCGLWVSKEAPCDPENNGFGYYADADGDGRGDAAQPLDCENVNTEIQYVRNQGDCDDDDETDAQRSPETIWYLDEDRDGYGTDETTQGCEQPDGYADLTNDCAPEDAAWSAICPWIEVSVGRHACGLSADGTMECWNAAADLTGTDLRSINVGKNITCGVLTSGSIDCFGTLEENPVETDYVSVSAGDAHACGLRSTGEIKCWGTEHYGEISGVSTEADFQQVEVGNSVTCGLHKSGKVSCWGANYRGQATPPEGETFKSISVGQGHGCGITTTGAVDCWGDSSEQYEPSGTDYKAVSVGLDNSTCFLHTSGEVECTGRRVPENIDFVAVSSDDGYACGLRETREIECWGIMDFTLPATQFNVVGTTPRGTCAATADAVACWGDPAEAPDLVTRAAQVDVSGSGEPAWSCAVHDGGHISCWGYEGAATPPDTGGFVSVSTGLSFNCGLRDTGEVECWGNDDWGQVSGAPADADFIAVSAGNVHGCAVRKSGAVECWGLEDDIVLSGTPTTDDFEAVSAGDGHTCALRRTGDIACWGSDDYGQSSAPSYTDFISVTVGNFHSCGLRSSGEIKCWGPETGPYDNGQVSETPTTADFLAVDATQYRNCGVHTSGEIECWGFPDLASPAETDFVNIGTGYLHSCGIHETGEVTCWGDNTYGESSPFDGSGVTVVEGGTDHICVLLDTGFLFCGGGDAFDQVSGAFDETFTAMSVGDRHSCGITADDGELLCWGDYRDGQTDVPDGLTGALGVAAGGAFTCALNETGTPVCWGDIEEDPPTGLTLSEISAGYAHACGLNDDGLVTCWGDDDDGQSTPPADTLFVDVQAGGWHTCGLLAEGGDPELGYSATCWGADDYGQTEAPPYRFLQLRLGDEHTCGLKADGLLACWGRNREGQTDAPLPNEI